MATKTEEKPSEDKVIAARNKNLDLALQQIAKYYCDCPIMRLGLELIFDLAVTRPCNFPLAPPLAPRA